MMSEQQLIVFETKYELKFSKSHYLILFWDEKPSEELINKIKTIEGINRITVH